MRRQSQLCELQESMELETKYMEMKDLLDSHLGGYSEDQKKDFFADEGTYSPEERASYDQAGQGMDFSEWVTAKNHWQHQRAQRLGMDSSVSPETYYALRSAYVNTNAHQPDDWSSEAQILIGWRPPDATLGYATKTSNLRESLKEEQEDLRVKQYALQVKQFFLKLDPRRAKMFFSELRGVGDAHQDWAQLFEHLDEIPDQPAKRLNPSYEKSKAFARVIRATRDTERTILAARKAYDSAKEWNSFLDKRAKEVAELPAPKTPKTLEIRTSAK